MKQKTKFKQTEIGKIPEDWEIKKIGDVAEVTMGQSPPGSSYNPNEQGVKFLQGVRTFGRKYPHFDIYTTQMTKKAESGSILLSVRAPVGDVNMLNDDICIGRGLAALTMKNGNNEFLYYLLKRFDSLIIGRETGSVFGAINSVQIKNLELPFPKDSEQQSIAKILSDLDAKIELNNKTNQILKSIGQVLFKKWFVDESKEEWKEGKLGELGTFKNGINYLRNEAGDTEFSIINVRDISNNKWLLKDNLDKIKINYKKAQDYLLDEKDIIIARSACPGKISLMLGNTDNSIFSGFSIRYRLNNLENYFYISFVLENLSEEIKNFSIGTTLSSVNQETLKNIKIIIPEDKTLQDFNKIIKPIFQQISINCFQSQKLSQIRDLLLPKLMSGEIRVK